MELSSLRSFSSPAGSSSWSHSQQQHGFRLPFRRSLNRNRNPWLTKPVRFGSPPSSPVRCEGPSCQREIRPQPQNGSSIEVADGRGFRRAAFPRHPCRRRRLELSLSQRIDIDRRNSKLITPAVIPRLLAPMTKRAKPSRATRRARCSRADEAHANRGERLRLCPADHGHLWGVADVVRTRAGALLDRQPRRVIRRLELRAGTNEL